MRLLVTGGAGFIGSNLVRMLVKRGCEVLNVDALSYAGNLRSLSEIETFSNYGFARVDITDAEAVNATIHFFKPTGILHLAAESHVDRSIDGPGQFIQTNVLGTFNLLNSALQYWKGLEQQAQNNFRFLHVSTDEVYGSLGPEGLFTECTHYDPHSPYSASKASSDHLARAWYDTYGLPVIITNCSNNYGPFQFPDKLIPVANLKCLHGEKIPVYGRGENIRDWLYVEDHCKALFAVLMGGQPGHSYNVGGNNEKRNIELVDLLCELMDELRPNPSLAGYSSLITFVTDRPGHDLRYAIDASKIRDELGWTPKQDHASGFRATVQWYLDSQDWWEDILSGDYKLERMGNSP